MGVFTVTPSISARPSFSRVASACVVAATFARPPSSSAWTANASLSAQRCSNEWNPPGELSAPGATSGVPPKSQPEYAVPSKVGIVGARRSHASLAAHTSPVPRGPKSHLWQPEAKTSDAQVDRRCVLDPEAVHAVDAEEDLLGRAAPVVRVRDRLGDLGERELDAARRVHPRDRDGAGLRRDPLGDRRDDRVRGRGLGRVSG